MYRIAVLVVCFLPCTQLLTAQVANFSVPASACRDQRIAIQSSVSGDEIEWDFCARDLTQSPIITDAVSVPGFLGGFGYKVVNDNGNFFGFVLSFAGNLLFRLDFGNSLTNTPSVVNLGNPGNVLNKPQSIEVSKVDGIWYAFVGYDSPGHGIAKLNFGTSLTNIPTGESIGNFGFSEMVFYDLKLVVEQAGIILVLLDRVGGSLVRVRFDNLTNYLPQSGDIYITSGIPEASSLFSFDIGTYQNQKIALLTSYFNNKIIRLDFGETLLQNFLTSASYTSALLEQPIQINIVNEAGRNYALVANNSSTKGMAILDYSNFSTTPADVSVSLPSLFSIDAARINGETIITGLGSSSVVKRLIFKNDCGATPSHSNLLEPGLVNYSNSGVKHVAVKASNPMNVYSYLEQIISVNTSISPNVTFDTQNNCSLHQVNFTPNLTAGITTYSWSFGDATMSSQASPSHIYTSAGTYEANLQVTATNGCTNIAESDITIYNQPSSDFALPSIAPFCTNQNYSFTNTSTYDIPSNPIWEWRLNGAVVSTTTNLNQAFASTATQVIELKASIPGCFSTSTQTFNGILTGPLVDFSASTGCQGSALQFANNTSGTGIDYSWDFGDGNISTQINPANTYSSFGNFDATLHADNGVCNNSTTKSITIYSKPQADFSLDLPPFSCQGTPSQFNDLTPNPTDSNLSSWSWSFGDASNGISGQRNPLYTYSVAGPYNVSLTVTTNFGCSAFAQKMVTITAAPPINFNNTPACLNQPTQFTDASGAGVKSWLWKIGNSTYTISNPIHTFTTSGSHNVTLTITGANDCIAQLIKTVTVPVAVTPNFSVENACSGKSSAFLDITSAGVDPVVIRDWDFGGLGSANGQAPKFIFPVAANHIVKLKTIHQSGCVYIGTKAVSIAASPKSLFTSSSEGGPPPLNVKFSNSSTGASSYLWKFNDKSSTTSSLIEPSFTFNELGDYQVELISFGQLGCTDSFSKPIRVVEPITDLSLTNLELLPDPNSGSLRPLVTIRNNGNIAVANVSILIDLSGGGSIKEKMQIDLQPNQSFTQALVSELVPKGLNYVCAQLSPEKDENLLNNRKCSTLGEEIIVFAPYPNPSEGELYIDWIAASGDVASIVIFNSTGGNAFDKKITATQPGLSQIILDVSNLAPGIYFVVFSYGGITKTHRFVMN